MTATLETIADGAESVVRIIGAAAAWVGLALVLLVAGNVLGRYVFGLSSVGMQEAEWHLMAVAALFGMAYCLNQGGEVRVDVLYDRFPPRAQAAVDAAAHLMLTLAALAIVWLSIGYVEQSYVIGEGSPDPGGLSHRYVLKAVIPLAFSVLALQAAAMTVRSALRIAAPPVTPAKPDPSGQD